MYFLSRRETWQVNRGQMCILFDNIIDSKYQVMTSQLMSTLYYSILPNSQSSSKKTEEKNQEV